jgi:TetR/AcrR family transcriptional regulator, transcriptional repressor for nem operon
MIVSEPDTRSRLLEVALELVQLRGYNAFSFQDLARRVGIKTASIHYHFPTKGDLGLTLVRRHRQVFADAFASIDTSEPDHWERLRRYVGLFRATLEDGHRMCLAGMLAIEYQSLPPELVDEVRGLFENNELWLTKTLKAGRKAGLLDFDGPAAEVARTLFAALEGAMLSACAFADLNRFDAAATWHLEQLRNRRKVVPTNRRV